MNVTELRDRCNKLIDEGHSEARVYAFTDTAVDELTAVEARELEPFNPFWSTVEGYIIQ